MIRALEHVKLVVVSPGASRCPPVSGHTRLDGDDHVALTPDAEDRAADTREHRGRVEVVDPEIETELLDRLVADEPEPRLRPRVRLALEHLVGRDAASHQLEAPLEDLQRLVDLPTRKALRRALVLDPVRLLLGRRHTGRRQADHECDLRRQTGRERGDPAALAAADEPATQRRYDVAECSKRGERLCRAVLKRLLGPVPA